MNRGLWASWGIILLQACATNSPQTSPAPNWLKQYSDKAATAQTVCSSPVGEYSVTGQASDSGHDYLLHEILFTEKLAGYPVEQVKISENVNKNGLIITAILAGVPLEKTMTLNPGQGSCGTRWYLKVDTGAVNAQLSTEAILWTGGVLMPISETNHVYLIKADDGALILHVRNKTWFLGALSIPFKVEKEFWLRYSNVESQVMPPDDSATQNYAEDFN